MSQLKLVPLDSVARMHLIVKRLSKRLAVPGFRHLTFVIEGEGTCFIESTHRDDMDTASILIRAAGSLTQI